VTQGNTRREGRLLASSSSQRKLGSSVFAVPKALDPSFRWDDDEARLAFSQKPGTFLLKTWGCVRIYTPAYAVTPLIRILIPGDFITRWQYAYKTLDFKNSNAEKCEFQRCVEVHF
jgi:hypothetical protein